MHPKTLRADQGYHVNDFVARLRKHTVRPHIARIDARTIPGLDGRTTYTEGYRISQNKRKRVEDIHESIPAFDLLLVIGSGQTSGDLCMAEVDISEGELTRLGAT